MTNNIFNNNNITYHPKEIPSTVNLGLAIFYKMAGYDAGKIGAYSFDYQGDADTIILARIVVPINLDIKEDITNIAIESLKKSIKDVQAEAYKKVCQLQDRIYSLLQIEYKPEEQL